MTTAPDLPWFTEARFGMFIHWSLFSIGGRADWRVHQESITAEHNDSYVQYFDPDLYDPRDWARRAREAGMRYVVFTTKHHEGFCMWDTALTDFSIMSTPYGRDVLRELVDAFRAEGIKIGLYHSLIDWHHPQFPIDDLHPLAQHPDAEQLNATRDVAGYREFLHGQIRELLTQYGEISYLFFDFSYADGFGEKRFPGKGAAEWGSVELEALARTLQPGIIINNRLDLDGDLVTPEQYTPSAPILRDGVEVPWEACQTITKHWAYNRDDGEAKDSDLIVRNLIDGVSKGGNLLLNVGPDGRGQIDARTASALGGVAEWMRVHGRAIHGAGRSPHAPPLDARYTQRGDRLYVHLFAWPYREVTLPGLAGKVAYAQLLNDGSELFVGEAGEPLPGDIHVVERAAHSAVISVPPTRPDVLVPVIEVFLRG